jgi:hypothetical protein
MYHKIFLFITIIFISQQQTCTVPLCSSCTDQRCQACYTDFTANTITNINDPTIDMCKCPDSMYYNSSIAQCTFCDIHCKSCLNSTFCITCLDNYLIKNGDCSTPAERTIHKVSLELTNANISNN